MAKRTGKSKKGKTPKELVDKHIQDKNDIISEEEFKNMEVGSDVDKEQEGKPLEIPNKKNRPKDESKDSSITTPWDVIED